MIQTYMRMIAFWKFASQIDKLFINIYSNATLKLTFQKVHKTVNYSYNQIYN